MNISDNNTKKNDVEDKDVPMTTTNNVVTPKASSG